MEEKKYVKMSLGTVICIVIIILLIIALCIVYYLGFIKNNDQNKQDNVKNETVINTTVKEVVKENRNSQSSNNPLENWPNIDTSKIVNLKEGYKYAQNCNEGNKYTISNDKRSITINSTGEKIDNFIKNIDEACIYFLGQGSLDFYVFLYEDGTVGYTTQNDDGKIKDFSGLSDIIKVAAITYTREEKEENMDVSEGTIIAIDKNGNIYDLGLLR